MSPPPLTLRRLDSLTGLRAIAALAVFGIHLYVHLGYPPLGGVAKLVLVQGYVGVSFFFILSGFVLAWGHRDGPRGAFYRRRFARVYPSHAVVWLVAVTIGASGFALGAGNEIANLLLVQSWSPSQQIYFSAPAVTWSLSCELLFYAGFPFVMPRLGAMARRGRRVILVGLIATTFLIPTAAQALHGGTALWFVYIFPLSRAAEFLAGVIVALEVRDGLRVPLWPAVGVGVAGYVLAGQLADNFSMAGGDQYSYAACTMVPFMVLLAGAASADLRGAMSPFRSRVLIRLGEGSYAFYLVHSVVIYHVQQHWDVPRDAVHGLVRGVEVLALSVLAAAILHLAVERPAHRALRPSGRRERVPLR